MSNIVESHARYIKNQDEESVEELFGALLSYDFADYQADILEMAATHRRSNANAGEATFLRTNGSSRGMARRYEFSPLFSCWASLLEPFLRGLHLGSCIFLCCRIGNGRPPDRLILTEADSTKKHYDASGNLLDDRQLEELFRRVGELSENCGKVTFSAFPDVWNMLFSNPRFRQLCDENIDKLAFFVNNDFEMLLRDENIPIRDQMINWRSGLNFYTCGAGNRHFLPTFHNDEGCINLLNTRAKRDASDKVVIGTRSACECGSHFVPMDIVFHKNNAILGSDGRPIETSPLRSHLKGRYACLQLHQDETGKITAFMTPVGDKNDEDIDFLHYYFSGFEIKVEFNRYFEVGSKRYCFWRSARVEPKEFRLS